MEQFQMTTLTEALEIIEQLPDEQQEMLIKIIRNRQIEKRRDEISQNARESLAAYRAGQLHPQSAESAISQLQTTLGLPEY